LKKFDFFFWKNSSQNYQTALSAVGTGCCADGNFACAEALLCRRQGAKTHAWMRSRSSYLAARKKNSPWQFFAGFHQKSGYREISDFFV
jgi:hypothetical protein